MVKLVNRACESHETYAFMSKVCEMFRETIENMLAKRPCLGGEGVNGC